VERFGLRGAGGLLGSLTLPGFGKAAFHFLVNGFFIDVADEFSEGGVINLDYGSALGASDFFHFRSCFRLFFSLYFWFYVFFHWLHQ
jgi:hypothetical protein